MHLPGAADVNYGDYAVLYNIQIPAGGTNCKVDGNFQMEIRFPSFYQRYHGDFGK